MATPYYMNRIRQRLAPQPDASSYTGTRPQDFVNRNLTNVLGSTAGLTTSQQVTPPGGVVQPTPSPIIPKVTAPTVQPRAKKRKQKERYRGLPIDPVFEALRRQYEDELSATLSNLTRDRAQIPLMQELILSRLGRDQALANEASDEDAIGRGVFRSGVRGQNLRDIDMNFGRERADVAQSLGQQYGGLAQAEAEARMNYRRQLDQALLDLAERLRQAGYNPGKR